MGVAEKLRCLRRKHHNMFLIKLTVLVLFVIGTQARGLDPIDSLFEICQRNELQVGLTLDEINQEGCLDTLSQWFGLTEGTIAQYFAAIDINNDNFITKKESQIAIQTLERKGGGGGGCDNPCSKDCRKECPGKLHTRRCRCEDTYTGKCENFYQGKWQTC